MASPTPRCGDSFIPMPRPLIEYQLARIRLSAAGAMIRDKWLNADATVAIPGIELLEEH